jgi:hypothetical protein
MVFNRAAGGYLVPKTVLRRIALPLMIVVIAIAGMAVLMIPKGQAQPAL